LRNLILPLALTALIYLKMSRIIPNSTRHPTDRSKGSRFLHRCQFQTQSKNEIDPDHSYRAALRI